MIQAIELVRDYGAFTAVAGVSFEVAAGELLVLVGGSGSGKTTTLKMLNRLIEPTAGVVKIDGKDTRDLAPHELRRGVGYVFQGLGLFPHMTVEANIGITLRLLGWEPARITWRVAKLLQLVELPIDTALRLPSELSGGQMQRVAVARALAAEPKVMLLDEPFGALDPLTRERLVDSFLVLRRRLALTAVLVTHDMVEALVLADRIGVLQDGQLVQIGRPEVLLQEPADDYVASLMATPRRQAARVESLLHTALQ